MQQALMQGVLRHDDLQAIKYPLLPDATWLPDSQARHYFGHFPRHLARAIRRTWLAMRNDKSRRAAFWEPYDQRHDEANAWAARLVELFPAEALAMSASEVELVDFAKARAAEADRLLLDGADLGRLEACSSVMACPCRMGALMMALRAVPPAACGGGVTCAG